MSDHDAGEGFFGHLDDPQTPSPGRDALDTVVHRGRQIRTRRHTLYAASSVATVTVLTLTGLGIAQAVRADRQHDQLIPGQSPSGSTSASGRSHHGHDGGQTLIPGGTGGQPSASSPGTSPTSTPSPGPCRPVPSDSASASPSPGDVPVVGASVPPLLPTPTSDCTTPSPSPSDTASPSESPNPTPSDTAEPTTSPSPSDGAGS
jgi:hypothetical protein